MRITYDEQIFAMHSTGGISRYITEIATRIARRRRSAVTIVAPIYVNKYLQQHAATSSMRVIGRFFPKLPKMGRPIQYVSTRIADVILPLFRSDVIHQTYYGPVRRVGKSRVVLTVHDMTHELLPEFSKDLGSLKAKRAAIAECDHIICVSENTKRDLLSVMNVEDSKISVVPLGATPLTVDPGACTWPSPFILFVGLRHGYKNFGKLLQSYADSFRLRESFNLICFGGGEFSKREKLEFARLGLNPEKITQIAGDDGTLAAYYSKAAAFVYPSLYEGFGLPILEAMGCGCPVACSKRSSFPEVAGGAARYFDPESSENMAEVLKDIVFSDTQRSSMIAEGHRRTGIFDWERCAEATEKIYATLT